MFSSGNINNNNNNNDTNSNNIPYNYQLGLPFYQYPSSAHPLISQDTADTSNILYHYYHHPLLSGQQLLPGYVTPENTAAANMAAAVAALSSSNTSVSGGVVTNVLPERPVKKDRHSKIYTAQGLRDRRVRLSTEIARQFFDLQDLLGYDKASETIAWLLSKSKKDIKELVEMKNKNLSSPSDSEMFQLNNHQGAEIGEPDGIISQNDSLIDTSKEHKKMKSKCGAGFQLNRKDSRTAKGSELDKARTSTSHYFEVGEKSGSLRGCADFGGKSTDPILKNQLTGENIMEESIMITRKLKPTSSGSLGYNQHNFSCLPQNWDMNGAATSASSCDATPCMNLSTELLISGKAWEDCNNQCLE